MYIKNKDSKDYTEDVRSIYKMLSLKYGYTAKITDFWGLLLSATGKSEYDILDYRTVINGGFESYLIDTFIDWREGADVDFSDVKDEILKAGEFTREEKLIINDEHFEELLWAIYLTVLDPTMNI